MNYYRTFKALLLGLTMIPAIDLSGQTRFSQPDTTPDYSSYTYLDECVAAIKRTTELAAAEDSVWKDTVSLDTFRLHRPLPSPVIEGAKRCLAGVNVDTISLKESHNYARALLVANRDSDVERMYLRLADSIKSDSARTAFFMESLLVYTYARPVRLDKVMQLYEVGLMNRHKDSIGQELFLRSVVGMISLQSGKQVVAHRIAKEILGITDTLSDKYRNVQYIGLVKEVTFPFLALLMTDEAVDSLSVSTESYRQYLGRVWKSLLGYDPQDLEIGAFGMTAPEPKGHFWYANTGSENQIKAINPAPVLEKGKVTIIYFGQGGCHANYQSVTMGRNNGFRNLCWAEIHKIRKIMEQYPNIKLVVVSSTFGSFADAPPLQPQQEADTLAHYFLGFHKLKGTQVVYKTDFITLGEYDRRRIDTETENSIAFQFGSSRKFMFPNTMVMIDELGKVFHTGKVTDESEQTAAIRLKAVMNRPANRLDP